MRPVSTTDPSAAGGGDDEARASAWRPSPTAARVYVKELGAAESWWVALLRFEAGGAMTIDVAAGPYLLYVLDGELIHRGRRLWPGATCLEPCGATPGESCSDLGCTLLIVGSAARVAER